MLRRATVVAIVLCSLVSVGWADLIQGYFGVPLTVERPTESGGGLDHDYNFLPGGVNSPSFKPTDHVSTTNYAVDDWHGDWSALNFNTQNQDDFPADTDLSGAEPYDVEAMYFDDDPYNYYIAIVTSFKPPPGTTESRLGDLLVPPGDLALDFGQGAVHSGNDAFRYNYGVNVTQETRPGSGNVLSVSGTPGTGVYQTSVSDWYIGTPSNAVHFADTDYMLTNFDPGHSPSTTIFKGNATVSYATHSIFAAYTANGYNAGAVVTEGETAPDDGSQGYTTSVIEITIPRTELLARAPGQTIGVQWTMGCRNDSLTLYGTVNSDQAPSNTPELPASALLAVAGLPIAALRRRDRRKR